METELSRLIMPEESLRIGGNQSLPVEELHEFIGKISIQQSCQMVELAVHIRNLLRADGPGLCRAAGVPPLPVRGEVDVFHQGGFLRRQQGDILRGHVEALDNISVFGRDFYRSEDFCPRCQGGGGAECHRAAGGAVLRAGVVDIQIPRGRTYYHKVINLTHRYLFLFYLLDFRLACGPAFGWSYRQKRSRRRPREGEECPYARPRRRRA